MTLPTDERPGDRLALSPSETARRLGIGRTTLYSEIAAGRLRTMKLGARRLISITAIAEWLADREADAQADDAARGS